MLIPRNLKTSLLEAAKYSPVILVNGARQTGKSTLVQGLFPPENRPQYISLDNISMLDIARNSPRSFIQDLPDTVILDEIQHAPQLFLPIKEFVDKSRKTRRFFLTGSANVLSLPKLAESLAGRMEIHTLWPLSQGEIKGKQEAFIDILDEKKKIPSVKSIKLTDLLEAIVQGGYPDILHRPNAKTRNDWYRSYIKAILERDVRELSNIEGLTALPNLLAILAARAGGLLNMSDLSRTLALPNSTLKRYLSLLEAVYLIVMLPPWFNNKSQRLVKTAKAYLNDTGLLCHLLGSDKAALADNRLLSGMVFENFVVMELIKQITWSEKQPKIYHYRTLSGQEIDIVLEYPNGKLVGIECKMSSSVKHDDFKWLMALKEQMGSKFHRGIVLYTGSESISFADNLEAHPVSVLWELSNQPAPSLSE